MFNKKRNSDLQVNEEQGRYIPFKKSLPLILFLVILNLSMQSQINVDNRRDDKVNWFEELHNKISLLQSDYKANINRAENISFGGWQLSEPYYPGDEIDFNNEYPPEELSEIKWNNESSISDGEINVLEEYEDPVVLYLRRDINALKSIKLPVYFGTSNAFKIWLNGEVVYQNEDNEDLAVDQEVFEMNFEKGDNDLLIKLVCYENHPTLYFSLIPSEHINNEITDILHSVYSNLSNDMEERKMYWEIEDDIWHFDLSADLNRQLAGNYLSSTDADFPLYDEAETALTGFQKHEDLEVIRNIYIAGKFREQLKYVSVNYEEGNERWEKYQNDFDKLMNATEVLLNKCLSSPNDDAEEAVFALNRLIELSEMMPIRLPSTPLEPGEFGAFYTKLKYYPAWDEKWRMSEDADVVVTFPEDVHKFVFWRGTNFIPHWVTEKGFWFDNEFNETWFSLGSAEPMSDKQCRYSHVRIIESNEARVIVHWRYALNDVNYDIAWPDKFTGWGDWSDEYYYIYPDAVSVRKVILHTSYRKENPVKSTDESGHEWQEGIVVYHPFTKPEEYLNIDAVHVANLEGDTGKWSWEIPGEPTTPTPEGSNIVMMNMKSDYKPFIISQEGCELAAYPGAQGGSHFRWRDHWPTTTEPTPGRNANGKQAAHGSFFHVLNMPYYEKEETKFSKVMLHGLTTTAVNGLVPVAKSWINPPELILEDNSGTIDYLGYDISERAYRLDMNRNNKPSEVKFKIEASQDLPAFNPVLIIENWIGESPHLILDGKKLIEGDDYTAAVEKDININRLVLWINREMDNRSEVIIK